MIDIKCAQEKTKNERKRKYLPIIQNMKVISCSIGQQQRWKLKLMLILYLNIANLHRTAQIMLSNVFGFSVRRSSRTKLIINFGYWKWSEVLLICIVYAKWVYYYVR